MPRDGAATVLAMTSVSPAVSPADDKPFGIFVGLLNALALYAIIGILVALVV